MSKLALLALFLALCACGERQKTAEAGKQAAAEPSGPKQCAAAGALACRIAPVESLEGACAQLRDCLASIPPEKGDALQITSCNAPSVQTPLASTAAPLEALAVISVEVQKGVAPSHAAYVFAKDANGWCPSVELLEPLWRHNGSCDTIVRAGAEGTGAAVRAERTCRMPLDRSERDAGASDVAERECVEAHYALSGSALKQSSRQRSEGACPAT
jgi:hypothetical protein